MTEVRSSPSGKLVDVGGGDAAGNWLSLPVAEGYPHDTPQSARLIDRGKLMYFSNLADLIIPGQADVEWQSGDVLAVFFEYGGRVMSTNISLFSVETVRFRTGTDGVTFFRQMLAGETALLVRRPEPDNWDMIILDRQPPPWVNVGRIGFTTAEPFTFLDETFDWPVGGPDTVYTAALLFFEEQPGAYPLGMPILFPPADDQMLVTGASIIIEFAPGHALDRIASLDGNGTLIQLAKGAQPVTSGDLTVLADLSGQYEWVYSPYNYWMMK